ncbi:S1/P1 nuclease [Talaromyces proteolyticus]|uniref:S1/P1 nuclease n=1 Tax=Talaromyces proteolyticus TaxID=1131652 RepID=A0AAD4KLV3_9EURO|nr:S1/P1 nuclease [Talaromyces proteolyticus]KAH8694159.1 S1/P1 nuclease [Talaromyces proteolyticus]
MRVTVSATALLGLSQHAFAWGAIGHRTVAYLAYNYLSIDTRGYLNEILHNVSPYDVSDAAVWPDEIRRSRPYTAGWHFIDAHDNPPHQCSVSYPADCHNENSYSNNTCIISAIFNQTSLFINPSTPSVTRTEALRFILHFLGDIHQPLHSEDAFRGGNDIKVCFGHECEGKGATNLHSVWDREILHKIVGLVEEPANLTEQRSVAKKWADGLYSRALAGEYDYDVSAIVLAGQCTEYSHPYKCSLEWVRESNAYVCSYAMQPGLSWLKSNDLSLTYYDGAKPIVEKQISMAGVRLAAWLEAIVKAAKEETTKIAWDYYQQRPLFN